MSTTAQQEITAPVTLKTGDFVWHELRTTDAKAATDFYTHVVGWKAMGSGDPGGIPYTLLSVGDLSTAGLMQLTPEMQAGGMKPAWVGFIGVDNVDAYAKRVEAAGGKLHCAPMDIPGIGRFASAEDPQGATFLLFKGSLEYAPSASCCGYARHRRMERTFRERWGIRMALLFRTVRLEAGQHHGYGTDGDLPHF